MQAQSERMENDIPSKQKQKESGHSHTYIRQNRLQAKNKTRASNKKK